MKDISELTPEELERTRTALRGVIESLGARKGLATYGSLLPEEDFIYNSLTHPERGDVTVTVLRSESGLQVYISNRRDPENPFSVMDYNELRRYPGRRPLGGVGTEAKEGQYGLYIITAQDRDYLRNSEANRLDSYSLFFGIADRLPPPPSAALDALKGKPVDQCTREEMWLIYKRQWDFDSRLPVLERELFGMPLIFSRYKQPAKEELLLLTPDRYKKSVTHLIRDIYPYSIRVVLRKDFPADHKKKLMDVHDTLKSLINRIKSKIQNDNHSDYTDFLKEMILFVDDIIVNDPELTRHV